MHTFPECVGCLFAQLSKMVLLHGIDPATHEQMVKELARAVPDMDLTRTPPELSRVLSDILIKHLGNDDPYAQIKRDENARAKAMLPDIRRQIEASSDPFAMAMRFAAAANVIDYGVPDQIALEHVFEDLARHPFAAFDIDLLRKRIEDARTILILGDNTGEVFYDRLLIEQLPTKAPITYAVRSRPVINDALLADACDAGIDTLATLMESGSHIPGTVPADCSDDFQQIYNDTDLIISKGQGNFETLSHEKRPLFFLFAVKCQTVARQIGHPKGSLMVLASPHFSW